MNLSNHDDAMRISSIISKYQSELLEDWVAN